MLASVAMTPAAAATTATAVSGPPVGLRRTVQMPQGNERDQEKCKVPQADGDVQVAAHASK